MQIQFLSSVPLQSLSLLILQISAVFSAPSWLVIGIFKHEPNQASTSQPPQKHTPKQIHIIIHVIIESSFISIFDFHQKETNKHTKNILSQVFEVSQFKFSLFKPYICTILCSSSNITNSIHKQQMLDQLTHSHCKTGFYVLLERLHRYADWPKSPLLIWHTVCFSQDCWEISIKPIAYFPIQYHKKKTKKNIQIPGKYYISVKGIWYSFWGTIKLFCLPSEKEFTLKGKNLLQRGWCAGKQTGRDKSCLHCTKWWKIYQMYPVLLI